jgi:hypothetical protein
MLQEFKTVIGKGIRKIINTVLHAYDEILLATSEGEVQTMAYHPKPYIKK